MIETQLDNAGRVSIRSSVPLDCQGPDADGWYKLSADAVGEVVRMAAQNPENYPQEDARRILTGRR